jgi:hypothetical protein
MVDHQHPEIIEIHAELKRDFLDIYGGGHIPHPKSLSLM